MAYAVLDIGKTLAKVTLWDRHGNMLARETRANQTIVIDDLRHLDVAGIDQWLGNKLRSLAGQYEIESIFPVGHGAAAVIVQSDMSYKAPIDYEQDYDAETRSAYSRLRDAFGITGSSLLPLGLNLGLQLLMALRRNPNGSKMPL